MKSGIGCHRMFTFVCVVKGRSRVPVHVYHIKYVNQKSFPYNSLEEIFNIILFLLFAVGLVFAGNKYILNPVFTTC